MDKSALKDLVPSIPYEKRKDISQVCNGELLQLHQLLRSHYTYGACVLGSDMLVARFQNCRKVPLEYGEFTYPSGDTVHHSWVVQIDGVIIDITADQFGIPINDDRQSWYRWWRER